MQALGQEEVSKHHGGHSDKASGERMCLHQRTSLCILPALGTNSMQQRGAGRPQDKMRGTGSWHTAASLSASSRMLSASSNWPCCRAGGAGALGMLMPSCKRGLQGLCQPLPQLPPLCPRPRPCFIFFASTCPRFGAPLAPRGTNPGPAQTDPDWLQWAPLQARGTDPILLPQQCSQAPCFSPAEVALRAAAHEGSSGDQRRGALQSHQPGFHWECEARG